MNESTQVIQIPIEDLVPNRFQPRVSFDEKALNDLANSIRQHGIIQPLVVRRLGDKYEIIAGERRYKAAQIAGLVSVPGIVANVNDQSSAEMALVENVQRQDLSAIEEAKSYRNILEAGDMTQEELAKKMGLSQSSVANKLRLLNLNEEVQNALLENKISERHARSLLALDDSKQTQLLHRIMDERLTVRQLDEIIKNMNNPVKDDVIDDVPLVNIDENLEEMQRQATDINPQVNRPSYNDNGNKFFNYEGVEEQDPFKIEESTEEVSPELIPQESTPEVVDSSYNNEEVTVPESQPASSGDFFNFGTSPQVEEQPASPVNGTPVMDNMIEEVLDVDTPTEIDSLDTQPNINIFDSSKINASADLPTMLNKIRAVVNEINTNNNVRIEEADIGATYKIIIDIEKGS